MKKFLSVACLAALFSSSVNANDNIAEFELGINDSNNIDVILKVKEDLKINNIRGFKGNCKIYYLKYASKFFLDDGIKSRWDGETRVISETERDKIIKNYLDKGYKKISDLGYTSIDEFDPDKILPKEKTDANGAKKPMLCKVYDASDSKTQKIPY